MKIQLPSDRFGTAFLALIAIGLVMTAVNGLQAASLTWAPGGNINADTGDWSGANNWSSGSAATWTDGSDAVFSRTTTNERITTMSTNIVANSLSFQLSSVATTAQRVGTAGYNLTITSGNVAIASGFSVDMRAAVAGSNGLNLTGGGTLYLQNTSNTFSGTVSVTSSRLEIAQSSVLGNANNSIALNNGTLGNNYDGTTSMARQISLTNANTLLVRENKNPANQTYSGTISGTGSLTFSSWNTGGTGSNVMSITGNNTYSGGTTFNLSPQNANTVVAAGSNTAFGTQGVTIAGSSKVRIDAGVTIANNVAVTSANGLLLRQVNNGSNFSVGTTGTLKSSFSGGTADVIAAIRAGTNASGAQQTLSMSFHSTATASNDNIRVSDVFSLSGTDSQTYVLQLSSTGISNTSYLGWLNGAIWTNAVVGNTASGGLAGYYAVSYDQFVLEHGGAFNASTMLGAYGVDTTTGSVWAVLNHNSDFAVVPEPASVFLISAALGCLLFFRRRQPFVSR